MTRALVVTGTDTDIGKTVVAAGLVAALDADYWKPVQAGLDGETDRETVMRLARLPAERAHAEAYRLTAPASPHRAAEIDGVEIDTARLMPPSTPRTLVIEGAGGLLVPLNRRELQIDLFARWGLPVLLVAATRLGTINHTLLSLEALRARALPLIGVLFTGDANADTQRTICDFGGVVSRGRLPSLTPLDSDTLSRAFSSGIDISAIRSALERAP
jgi:dethiobiotin synthetase